MCERLGEMLGKIGERVGEMKGKMGDGVGGVQVYKDGRHEVMLRLCLDPIRGVEARSGLPVPAWRRQVFSR